VRAFSFMPIVRHLIDAAQGKHPIAAARSPHWPKVRADYLKLHPVCELCGGKDTLTVHHVRPFHLHPDLELDPSNLITLCEAKKDGVNCHLFAGHLGNFRSFNKDVRADAAEWSAKIKNRPLTES